MGWPKGKPRKSVQPGDASTVIEGGMNSVLGAEKAAEWRAQERAKLPAFYSDEAIAQRELKPKAMCEVVKDEWYSKLDARIEYGDRAPNEFEEVAATYKRPGYEQRYLSKKNKRGRRGWEPITTKDGKGVEVEGMVLAEKPVEYAEAQRKRNAAEAARAVNSIREANRDNMEKAASDNPELGGYFNPMKW